MTPVDPPAPVFSLRRVVLPASGPLADTLETGIDLSVEPGEALCIVSTPTSCACAFADVLCGLRLPASGRASFCGQDWSTIHPLEHARRQSRLRRVFSPPAWLGYLPVDEEIALLERYHTRRSAGEILDEAAAWCRHFGLPGLPRRPAPELSPVDQQRAALARAFVGSADAVVLEEPTAPDEDALREPVAAAIRRLSERGGAGVVVCASEEAGLPDLPCVQYRALLNAAPEKAS